MYVMGPMVDQILKILTSSRWAITRSRAKKIKEAMQGLVQSTWAEFANLSRKTLTFKIGLKEEEPTLVHVIQATDGGSIA
jgi:hypothetical protein